MIIFLVICAGIVALGVLVALVAFFCTLISDSIDRWKREVENAAVQNERASVERYERFRRRSKFDSPDTLED